MGGSSYFCMWRHDNFLKLELSLEMDWSLSLLAFRMEDQELTGLRYGSCRVDEKFLSVACIYASLIECF